MSLLIDFVLALKTVFLYTALSVGVGTGRLCHVEESVLGACGTHWVWMSRERHRNSSRAARTEVLSCDSLM